MNISSEDHHIPNDFEDLEDENEHQLDEDIFVESSNDNVDHSKFHNSTEFNPKKELKILFGMYVPVSIGTLLSFLMGVIDLIFIGHLPDSELLLAAAAVGNMFSWMTFRFSGALCAAMDTLSSQAHGSKNPKILASIFQTALFVHGILTIPTIFLWYYSEPCLIAMGIPKDIAQIAAQFIIYLLPSLPGLQLITVINRHLQNQSVVHPPMYVAAVSNLFNVFFNYLFIHFLDLGFIGSPMATTTSRILQPLLLIVYCRIREIAPGSWSLPSSKYFFSFPTWSNITRYLKFGFEGGLPMIFESLAFESSVVFVSWLNNQLATASHAVALNIAVLFYLYSSLPFAISVAARTGQLLGAGDYQLAKYVAIKVAIPFTMGWMFINALVCALIRHLLATAFTTDQKIVDHTANILIVAAAFQFFDGLQTISGALLRACGKPLPSAIGNFIGYYVIGIPLGLWMMLTENANIVGADALNYSDPNRVIAIWWGLLIGLGIVAITLTYYVYMKIDWIKCCEEALERIALENVETMVDDSPPEISDTLCTSIGPVTDIELSSVQSATFMNKMASS